LLWNSVRDFRFFNTFSLDRRNPFVDVDVCSELVLTREDAIRYIVREWMEKNTYLPVHELDEDGDVDRSA